MEKSIYKWLLENEDIENQNEIQPQEPPENLDDSNFNDTNMDMNSGMDSGFNNDPNTDQFGVNQEKDDQFWILERLFLIVKNFDKVFRRFEFMYPNCSLNDIIEERLLIMKKLLVLLAERNASKDEIIKAYKIIAKFITITDKYLTQYIKDQRKKEVKEIKNNIEKHEEKDNNEENE